MKTLLAIHPRELPVTISSAATCQQMLVPGSRLSFAYGGVTLCADAFQASSATRTISYFLPDQQFWLGSFGAPERRLLVGTGSEEPSQT
jgi:hypothetical protein